MTTLIWQTSLILLCAYFLGAWVACLLRRMLGADAHEMAVMETATASPVAPRSSGPPVRRADPKPIAIETIQRTAPQATAGAAKKFEEVLTTAPKVTPPAPPVTRTVPPAASVQPQPEAPAAGAAPTAQPVSTAPAATVPLSATPATAPPTPPAAAPAASVAATPSAAAALAAAAAAAETLRQTAAQVAKPAPAPVQSTLPAASSGAGPSAVSAPLANEPADDLTRIRPIDVALQKQLLQLGITRYRQIAGWQTADVNRISTALGFKGRIEQENWIEQAQILSRGGETAFTRRLASGQVEQTAPTPSGGQPKAGLPAAPPPAAVPPARATPAAPVAATVAPVAATKPEVASRAAFGQAAAPSVQLAAPAPASVPAPVAMASASAPAAPANPPRAPSLEAVPGMAGAAASAAAAGLGAAAASISTRDNLQRISGINAEVEKLLNVQGITRYSQMAAWTPADALRIDRMLGYEGRVAKESWIEQASLLARGNATAFSRQFDQRGTNPRQPAADAPRAVRAADPVNEAAPAAVARPSDMSTLRSVRSEAYSPPAQRGAAADDLKRIRGVGVLIEKKLNSMGITTYAQVANWSSADIDRVSNVLDFRGRIERENWVEQARILSAGGQTEFSRRVDRGDVGH